MNDTITKDKRVIALPRGRELDISETVVMGIVNVTPDSFSDGGQTETTELALKRALQMISDGAEIIDIGAESTRPGAELVSESAELARVVPVVEALREQSDVVISVDTYKSAVAKAALDSGADIINDISAGLMDERMIPLIADTDAGFAMMHMQGSPQTMQIEPRYDDVVIEVAEFLRARIGLCLSAGISPERLVIDPGIGFGKTHEHNLALLNNTYVFTSLGTPVLIGASRKSFIGRVEGEESSLGQPDQRLGGSIAAALTVVSQGVAIVRVHDVRETVQAIRVLSAISSSCPSSCSSASSQD